MKSINVQCTYISCLLLISLSKSCQGSEATSLADGSRDARRLQEFRAARLPLRSPWPLQGKSLINTSIGNAWTLTPATPNSFPILLLRPPLTLPRPFSGSAASCSLSSWSTVCSSAVPQARQPRDSPLHRLFKHLHTRAGAPHFPSGRLLLHSGQNAHTPTPPCYEQQRRNTTRRTRLSWRRLSHNLCFHPAHLCKKRRNLRLRNQSVPAFRMLFVPVSCLREIK